MPIIEWTEEFSVGHRELDEQHRVWLSIYNEAHDRMMDPDETRFQTTGMDALIRMRDYGRTHFAFEETYMEKMGYPDIENHKMIHDRFSREVDKFIHDLETGQYVLNSEVIKRIENWLVHHILKEDMKLKACAAPES